MKLILIEHKIGYGWMIFENMTQGFIEKHEVGTSAMMVELNHHHTSKSRI
jgi:hypothetical protein